MAYQRLSAPQLRLASFCSAAILGFLARFCGGFDSFCRLIRVSDECVRCPWQDKGSLIVAGAGLLAAAGFSAVIITEVSVLNQLVGEGGGEVL